MGLNDLKSEGDWRLASNGLNPSYLNWHKGEPTNEPEEDCALLRVALHSSSWDDTWADAGCTTNTFVYWDQKEYSLHALCEYDSFYKFSRRYYNKRCVK